MLLLIPLLPFIGFLVNASFGRRLTKRVAGAVACGAMILSFVVSVAAVFRLLSFDPESRVMAQTVYEWITSGDLTVPFTLRLDPLSAVMILIVTGIGSLIHVYSTAYMHEERDAEYARYFSYLNLFATFMLVLVLGANFLVLFVGWEGVGLCLYLLIGFWYQKKSASDAGKKAFIVNRIGDFGFVLGVATAFFAGTIGLVQNDIKRVLAYSTVSQLGYMFLAMGVGAYAAGIFHLYTHAFFKALLFLGSGAVIHALAGEQDLRRMGGLKRELPVTYWTFLIGALAIAGVPLLSGFFSKDEILFHTFASGHTLLWVVGLLTSLLTAIYMFRLVFLAFHGPSP